MASLMNAASAGAPNGKPFTPADPAKIVAPQMKDTVDRIVAAGMKIMYSPQMKDEREQAVSGPDPIPKKLCDNVVGLTLTLDQQTKGGIPVEALFPAAMLLLTEAAQLLTQAGQDVSDEDYKDAARMIFVLMGKKLGGTDEQIMAAAQQAMPGGGEGGAPEPEVPADESAMNGMGGPTPPEDQPIPDAAPMRPMPTQPQRAAMAGDQLPDEDVVQ